MLTAVWDHVLRERILDLEFVSEDQALCWVSECADDWLAGRKLGAHPATHADALSADGGQFGSTKDAPRKEHTRSIDLTTRKSGRSLHELMASDAQAEVHLEAPASASAAMLKSRDVAPSRVKQLTGVIFTCRREQST